MDLETIRQQNEERRKLKERATPGPWTAGKFATVGSTAGVRIPDREWQHAVFVGVDRVSSEEVVKFAVAARNDPVEATIDELVSEVERLRAENEQLRQSRVIRTRVSEGFQIDEDDYT